MGKLSQDIPAEQRPFFKHFEKVAYRHNYSEVFDDYLTMMINWFANGTQQEWRDQALKKYTAEEKAELNLMFEAHIRLFEEMIIKREYRWYDALGDIYQTITSNWKASGMGQFFTPMPVVEIMAQIVISDDCLPYSMVSEPACGSGRMVLAAHVMQPLNYYHAVDLDLLCAKMTALNMCFHNAAGVVSHCNTLSLEEFRHFIITRVQVNETTFVPLITVTENHKEAHEHLWGLSEFCRIMQGRPRTEAYKWLAKALYMPREYVHIGMFGEVTCHKVIELSKNKYANL